MQKHYLLFICITFLSVYSSNAYEQCFLEFALIITFFAE